MFERIYKAVFLCYNFFIIEVVRVTEERELERHRKILEQIKLASTKEELPNISLSAISSYLAANVYFDDVHISQTLFKPVLNAIVDYSLFIMPEVKEAFLKVLRENYPNHSEGEYLEKYWQIAKGTKITNILVEVHEKNVKLRGLLEKRRIR